MYTKSLKEVDMADVALAGGKGASLGEVTQAGVRVPAGFVVTTAAFRASAGGEMPPEVAAEIRAEFTKLRADYVAVRSSAVMEDSGDASWAGQLETLLNVTEDRLIAAVKACWASLASSRATAYAQDHNVPKADRAVAVVVQKMVQSDVAGVLFTADPVLNDTSRCVVEACFGLGELLVQGAVVPERFVVDKPSHTVMEYEPHHQTKQLVYHGGRNRQVALPKELLGAPTLAPEQLEELVTAGLAIEQHYGRPQDIEWAIEDGELFIVQARPVTTLAR